MWPKMGIIPTYSIFYGMGIFVHFLICPRLAKQDAIERRVWLSISLCYLAGMSIGAKLLYDLRYAHFAVRNYFRLNHWLAGGLWGGLLVYVVLSVIAVMLLAKRKRPAFDLIALTVPIPWILAKIGCLLNGCCYGRECSLPWAITFPEAADGPPAGVPLHPTQLYEIALMVVILLICAGLKRDLWQGTKLLWFLVLYGLGRAVIDLFKAQTGRAVYVGPVTVTQIICLGSAILALLFLILLAHRKTYSDYNSLSSTS